MSDGVTLPALRYALPLDRETRWSDLLAVLVATDPGPLCQLLDLDVCPGNVTVKREVIAGPTRADLVLCVKGHPVAVLEVKVLAGLGSGRRALSGYPRWRGITWEQVDRSLPTVGAGTVWNDLAESDDFAIALRARMAWVHHRMNPSDPVRHDLVQSAAGNSAVLRLYADTPGDGYQIMVDVEESLSVRAFRGNAGRPRQPRGPMAKVCLLQNDVRTASGFNWDHLRALWPVMDKARGDWMRRPAHPKAAQDRAAQRAMVARGGPDFLGLGFGDAQARRSGSCMFGARIQFAADIRLGELAESLRGLGQLVADLAASPDADTHPGHEAGASG